MPLDSNQSLLRIAVLRQLTVVYATMGYVTSERMRQIFPILPLNCFVRPALEIMSPSRAYSPPT